MTEIVFYENPDDLIKLYNDANDGVDDLVSRHIFVCLANESFSIANTAHPVFNIEYLNTLVRGTGATVSELEGMVKLLRVTKDRKDAISNWQLLFECAKSESGRRQMDAVTLLAGLT